MQLYLCFARAGTARDTAASSMFASLFVRRPWSSLHLLFSVLVVGAGVAGVEATGISVAPSAVAGTVTISVSVTV